MLVTQKYGAFSDSEQGNTVLVDNNSLSYSFTYEKCITYSPVSEEQEVINDDGGSPAPGGVKLAPHVH